MPEISQFLGIVVTMPGNDRDYPCFHAKYGDYEVIVGIDSGVISGQFPRRALGFVLEWYVQHASQLRENWRRVQNQEPLKAIEPLE